MSEIGISDLRTITSLVKENFKMDLGIYVNSYLIRRFRTLTEGKYGTTAGLIAALKQNTISGKEITNLFKLSCTDIFRDPSFWRILKKLLEETAERTRLRIWVADDYSGQELIALLISLKESGLLSKAEVLATARDENILDHIKTGKIPLKSMEQSCSNYRKWKESESADLYQYFKCDESHAVIVPELFSEVKFSVADISGGDIPSGTFDLILFRNVMLNYHLTYQCDLIPVLHRKLRFSGLLATGAKENISRSEIASKFSLINSEEKIYKKIKE